MQNPIAFHITFACIQICIVMTMGRNDQNISNVINDIETQQPIQTTDNSNNIISSDQIIGTNRIADYQNLQTGINNITTDRYLTIDNQSDQNQMNNLNNIGHQSDQSQFIGNKSDQSQIFNTNSAINIGNQNLITAMTSMKNDQNQMAITNNQSTKNLQVNIGQQKFKGKRKSRSMAARTIYLQTDRDNFVNDVQLVTGGPWHNANRTNITPMVVPRLKMEPLPSPYVIPVLNSFDFLSAGLSSVQNPLLAIGKQNYQTNSIPGTSEWHDYPFKTLLPIRPECQSKANLAFPAEAIGTPNSNFGILNFSQANNGGTEPQLLINLLIQSSVDATNIIVNQMRKIVDVSLFCLDILPNSINDVMEQIKHGYPSLPKSVLNGSEINHKIDSVKVVNCLDKWLFNAMNVKNDKIFGSRIVEIQEQSKMLFGANQDQSSVQRRAIMLFFYIRLYRKLAGLLESPFNGITDAYKTCTPISEKEALLIWIGIAQIQFAEQLATVLNANYPTQNATEILQMAQHFDALDLAKESMELAQWVTEATIAPIVDHPNFISIDPPTFLAYLSLIQSQNIACLMLSNRGLDLDKFVNMASEYLQRGLGATQNIQLIFIDAIIHTTHSDNNNGLGVPTSIQNAILYLKIYQTTSNYLSDQLRSVIVTMDSVTYAWDAIRNFLDQSAQQLHALITQWQKAKAHPFSDRELEEKAIQIFVKKNCQPINDS